jgi:hypothetical protein
MGGKNKKKKLPQKQMRMQKPDKPKEDAQAPIPIPIPIPVPGMKYTVVMKNGNEFTVNSQELAEVYKAKTKQPLSGVKEVF